jgi:threonine-phosphate decarboxylase
MKSTRFSHGGNLSRMAATLAIPEEQLLDFSASITPLGMPEAARLAIVDGLERLGHYPDPEARGLAHAAAAAYNLDPETVLAANGSTELIYLLPRALRPGRVLLCGPGFAEYERAAQLAGAKIKWHPLKRKAAFRVEPAEFIAALAGCDLAFLCNPNNPTGHGLERKAVIEIAKAARRAGCILALDEAFADFCPELSLLGSYRNSHLLIIRSLTKFFALPGLRAGFLAGPPRLLARIAAHKEPWSVNTLAEKAGCAALADDDFRERTLQFTAGERGWLAAELARRTGAEIFPAAANYLFLETPHAPALIAGLLRQGIAVRDCANFRGLNHRFIRVAVRSRPENLRLLAAIETLAGGVGGCPV